ANTERTAVDPGFHRDDGEGRQARRTGATPVPTASVWGSGDGVASMCVAACRQKPVWPRRGSRFSPG
ncbi:hypothetical protein, partial [Luteibacter sp. UNC138MFCol5.1]|uniref:hypothetical protein n=1 Tax=Luteibacter sp. UNC138MFCol5.1 TaxID=1502774 RepID=UPI001C43489D